jgi:hypothetical protein
MIISRRRAGVELDVALAREAGLRALDEPLDRAGGRRRGDVVSGRRESCSRGAATLTVDGPAKRMLPFRPTRTLQNV